MRLKLNTLTLPRHAEAEEKPDAIVGRNITILGKLNVDISASRRSWIIKFPVITKSEWAAINALYKTQIGASGAMLTFEGVAEGAGDQAIPATTVWMTPSSRTLLWAGSHAEGYSITLEEENADS